MADKSRPPDCDGALDEALVRAETVLGSRARETANALLHGDSLSRAVARRMFVSALIDAGAEDQQAEAAAADLFICWDEFEVDADDLTGFAYCVAAKAFLGAYGAPTPQTH